MIIKKESLHISYLYEENDSFFQLGYQMINKQKVDNVVKCLKVSYNGKIKIMYSIEKLVPIRKILDRVSNNKVINIIKNIYHIINKSIEDGFFIKEAFDVSYDRIFFDSEKECIVLMLLPVNDECDMSDEFKWNERLNNTVLTILNQASYEKESLLWYVKTFYVNEKPSFERAKKLFMSIENKKASFNGNTSTLRAKKMYLDYVDIIGEKRIDVYKDDMIFGSSEKMSDVVIYGSKVISRMHFRIIKKENKHYLTDLDSTNHTYCNGHMLTDGEEIVLRAGDIIKAANVELIVRCE